MKRLLPVLMGFMVLLLSGCQTLQIIDTASQVIYQGAGLVDLVLDSSSTTGSMSSLSSPDLEKLKKTNECQKCDLQLVDLTGANLEEANLQYADLWRTDLRGANLQRANLKGADLRLADFRNADLQGANLQDADLWETDLRGANLQRANLKGADIQNANLEGANLWKAKLDPEGIKKARASDAINVPGTVIAKKPSPTVTVKKPPTVKPATTKPAITRAQGRDTTPPTIQIASSIAVKEDSPTIRGRVSDNEKVVQVTVEGRAANLRSNGRFSFKRYVPPSGTKVTIEAVDEWGNRSTKVVRLIRKKVETATRRFNPLDPTKFSARRNPNAAALIIGITKYKRTVDARFADKDAQFFSDYARRKLGVPQSNIKVLTNEKADLTDIFEAAANWLPSATQAGKSDVYIFYAGHGLSSADGKEVYLIPYTGSPTLLEQTALHRSKLFKSIADARPRSVTVFLDTCYSGTARTNEILVASRGIRVVPRELEIPTRFTVFSAASMTQTAQMLDETGHGLFSYWLMKGMEGGADKNKDRKITTGELHDYVRNNVTRLRHDQTPQLKGNKETVLMRW